MKTLSLGLALPLAALVACAPRPVAPGEAAAGGPPRAAAARPGPLGGAAPGVVDAATALALAAAGARVVDVRTASEFAGGHVAGALNVPFDELAGRAGELGEKDAPIVLYCRSGRRSGIAAEVLRELGYTRVYDAQRYDVLAGAARGG